MTTFQEPTDSRGRGRIGWPQPVDTTKEALVTYETSDQEILIRIKLNAPTDTKKENKLIFSTLIARQKLRNYDCWIKGQTNHGNRHLQKSPVPQHA